MILLLTPLQAVEVWNKAREQLDRAFDFSWTDTAQDFYKEVEQGRAQLWSLDGGYALTRVIDGKKRVLQYVAIGGERMDSWLPAFLSVSQEWARDHQCVSCVVTGRRGWEKKLRGFKLERVTLTKEL